MSRRVYHTRGLHFYNRQEETRLTEIDDLGCDISLLTIQRLICLRDLKLFNFFAVFAPVGMLRCSFTEPQRFRWAILVGVLSSHHYRSNSSSTPTFSIKDDSKLEFFPFAVV